MSFFSFSNSDKDELSILLDIGNGCINGALCLFSKTNKPKIFYTIKMPFTVKEQVSSAKLLTDMNSLLDKTITSITKNSARISQLKNKAIHRVMISVSSPWFSMNTKKLVLNQEQPFLITKNFLDAIIDKEEDMFETKLSENNGKKSDFVIIEKSIIHTMINGYPVSNIIGKKTKNLEAYLSLSIVDRKVVDKIYGIILKNTHVPKESITIHTFPILSFITIRDIFSHSSSFVIMDITAEVTDITLVENEVVLRSVSVPSGRNFIIRQIAKKFEVTTEIAESDLHLYSNDRLDPKMAKDMEDILVSIEKEWAIYLENGLEELSLGAKLPGIVYLTVDDDVSDIYKNFLTFSKTDTTADFRKGLNVIHINNEVLSGFFEKINTITVNEFIAILTIFYNKLFRSM